MRSAPSTVSNLIAVKVAIASSSPAVPGDLCCRGRDRERRAPVGPWSRRGITAAPHE